MSYDAGAGLQGYLELLWKLKILPNHVESS